MTRPTPNPQPTPRLPPANPCRESVPAAKRSSPIHPAPDWARLLAVVTSCVEVVPLCLSRVPHRTRISPVMSVRPISVVGRATMPVPSKMERNQNQNQNTTLLGDSWRSAARAQGSPVEEPTWPNGMVLHSNVDRYNQTSHSFTRIMRCTMSCLRQ